MPKIRLAAPGMEKYTAMFGTTEFKDGVSVEEVSAAEIRMLGSITRIMVIDDAGEEKQGGATAEQAAHRGVPLPVEKKLEPLDANPERPAEITPPPAKMFEGEVSGEQRSEGEQDELSEVEKGLDETPVDAPAELDAEKRIWTQAELEQIADDSGIKGLREIADPLGVRDNSINGLITEIVRHQNSNR